MIAILEDDEGRTRAMQIQLTRLGREAVFFTNAPEMLSWLPANLPSVTLMSLDHDLGPNRQGPAGEWDPGDGRQVADALSLFPAQCPVIVHSSHGPAAAGMQYALEGAGWEVVRAYPFNDLDWIASSWVEKVTALLLARESIRIRPA